MSLGGGTDPQGERLSHLLWVIRVVFDDYHVIFGQQFPLLRATSQGLGGDDDGFVVRCAAGVLDAVGPDAVVETRGSFQPTQQPRGV